MYRRSRYIEALPDILATLHGQQDEQGNQSQQAGQGMEEPETIHVYPITGGGILLSRIPIEQERPTSSIVESTLASPETPSSAKSRRRQLPPLVHQMLLLFLFLLLDSTGGILTDLMMPTVTITLMPEGHSMTLQSSARLGRLLAPVRLSESQSVPTTGYGHQDARSAQGTLTFYNAAFTAQTVEAGTTLTADDGVEVVTAASVTIPANVPPSDGVAQVLAHTIQKGAQGNIAALDINMAFSPSLYVKNLTPFYRGQDERDYRVVSQSDLDMAAAALKQKVRASMSAALNEQLSALEQLQKMPCPASISTDHQVGEEASQVEVSLAQTCTAIAYNSKQLAALATKLLMTQAAHTLGQGYALYGEASLTITKVQLTHQTVVLSFLSHASFVYQINEAKLLHLLAGQPRLVALRLLAHLGGIKRMSISGIANNQELPTDITHIHLLLVFVAA